MPTSYSIDRSRGVVLSTATGTVTDDDVRAHQAALRADAGFGPDLNQLYDFRAVERVEVTSECIRELARQTSYGPRSRRAFVVANDLQYGLARMFQILTEDEPARLEVFRDADEARGWLGLPA